MQYTYPLSVPDFAVLTRRSPDSIRAGVRAGKIQCHRNGERGWIYFTTEDVEAYFEASLVPARLAAVNDAG